AITYDRGTADKKVQADVPPTAWIRSFEYQGTQDRSAQAAICMALGLRQELGDDTVFSRMSTLRGYIRNHVASRGLTCRSPDHPQMASAMVSFVTCVKDRIKAWLWFREQGFDVGLPVW